jgi:hypothetical protein
MSRIVSLHEGVGLLAVDPALLNLINNGILGFRSFRGKGTGIFRFWGIRGGLKTWVPPFNFLGLMDMDISPES